MANISWKNGVNGNFGTAANWNPGTVPTTADIAQINLNGTYTVLLNVNRTLSGLTLGGSSGTQTLNNNGFTLALNGASTVGANGVLNLTSGTINGTGALTVSGKLNWSGGTLSGTGKKTISGALNLSNDLTLSTTTLETTGTTIWIGNGTLYTSSAAIWNNTSTGTIDLQSDADFSYNTGTKTTFNNAGSLTKSNGTTTDESYISGFFNNTGTVQVKAGTLNLSGGGTNTGSFSIDTGATLRITAGYNFDTGNNVTGAGKFNIESGTTTVNAASTWSAPVNLINGTLTGAGALTISNQLNWSGGTLSGTGKKTVTGTLNLSGNQYLDGTTLETTGTTVWTGNGTFFAQNAAIWNNTSTGTIDLQSDADFYYYTGTKTTFNNAGTFTKSNGTTTDESYISGFFNNTGTVQVKAGTLNLSGGGTNTGSFSIDTGATLRITAGYNFNTGNSVTGAGNFNIESGTTTVNAASTWSAPVNLINGTLTGAGALTISNQLNWSGGTLSGTGKKTVTGTLNLSGNQYLDGTTLETTGTTVWTGNGTFFAQNAAIWNNTSTGTIDLQSDADFYYYTGTKTTFNNAGTFTKSNGTTTDESYISGFFNNTGTVQVKAGTLNLSGGGTNTGSFSIDTGATLRITAGYNFNTGNSVTGAGNFNIESGTTTVNAASTWSAPVNLINGTLTGAGALTISNQLNWSGATLSGTGKKTVTGTLNLSSNQYLDGTTLETTGATVWIGSSTFYANNGAIWNNTSTGTIDLQNDSDFSQQSGNQSTFNNAGTFTKSNGTTTDDSFIGFVFNNTGTVQVKAGTLSLGGGGTNTGSFSIDAGGTLRIIADYNFNTGNSITGAGNFNIESGTTTVNAASTWSAPVNLINGGLTGAGALTISNKLNWSGGTLSGTAKKTVIGTLNLSGNQYLDGTTLETTGVTVWTGNGTLYTSNGAIWNNTSTGTIDLQNDSDFSQWYGNQSTFNNAGTFTKSNGTTTDDSYISGLFNNTGTVQVNKGRLRFTGGYTQTAGTTNLSGGSLAFDYSPLNLQGGNLTGIGTITGNVNNTGGQINPGNTIGTLTVAGDYSQTGTGTVNLELGSDTSFDKLAITGAADVGGILKLNLTNGYTPTIGTKFTVLTYSSATAKSFNTIQGIDISSNLAFAPTSTGNNLILEVVDQVKDLGTINFTNPQSVTDFVGDTDLFDFYRFNVTTASNVQVKLTNLTANANVWLVDGLGRTIAQGVKTGTANEVVSSVVDAGTYYVRVFRPAAGNNTNYDLQVATSTAYWPVQFGTFGQEQNSGVSNDSVGSVFAAGFTTGAFAGNTNAGNYDGYITKYNPDGSPAWIKQFGTSGTDYALGTGNDNAGNVYAAGYTNGAFTGATNLGSNDGFITKYTAAGTLAWVKQFGTAADDTSVGISVDSNGNSYVIGKTYGAFAGNVTQGAYDAYIAKYDTNGTQTWIKQFGTNQDDEAIGVSLDSNDNIYVLGATAGAFAGNTNASGLDVFVSKYNSSGTQAWVKQLGSSGNNYANINGISTDSTGNVFITGFTDGAFSGNTSLGSYDGFVAKYSTTGTLDWVQQFGTTSDDYSIASKTDSAGNTYVTGWTSGQLTGNTALGGHDGFLAKYNTSGTRLWVKQFGTSSNDYANGLSIDKLGNIYVSGWTDGSFPTYTNQGGQDSYIALFDTNGNQLSIPAITTVITLAATDSDAGETTTGVTANPGTFTLTRTGDLTQAITVNYTLSGSATNGTDYSSLPGTINFAAGVSSAIVTITPTDDNIFEGTETAILTLTTGTGYALDLITSAVVNIADNDLPSISLAVSPASVVEDGLSNLVYTFTRTGSTANALTVNYTVGGNATFNTDYTQTGASSFTATTGNITFAAGSSTATLTVDPTADTTVETDETVVLTLATAPGYTINTPAAVIGTITNDDSSALPVISVAATDANAAETATGITANPGQFTLTRLGGNINQAVTVNYTLTGTATNGTDYTSLPTSVTFAAGSSTAIVTVTPTNDTIFEATETAILTLAIGTGYTVSTTNTAATVNIADNDLQPTINLSANQTIVEGNTNPQNVSYTVTLSNASTQAITVQYATANGTAIAGSDYTSTSGTLTFNPGVTSQVINIPILNDSINEANETFTLNLASPINASLGTAKTATTAITDTLSASVTTTLPGSVENLTLTGTAAINGTGNANNNVIRGNSANNTLTGLDGNDTYSFLANTALGTDTITETTTGGIDNLDFTGTTAGVNVNLGITTSQTVNSRLKLILSANNVIENATGGTGNDRLTGNALNNTLNGSSGNDQLQGLGGDDILWGGLGDDILTGGLGNDQYRFQGNGIFSSSLGVDYITQFDAGQDKIALSLGTFNAITNTLGQSLTDFAVVSDDELVNASNARIVYSQSTGSVFYNQDGNILGTGTVFEFARLGNLDITLASSDFTLIV
jgi:Ca2+-binding RTX toxin-like protein